MSLGSPLVPVPWSSDGVLKLGSEILRIMSGVSAPSATKPLIVTTFEPCSPIGLESLIRPVVTALVMRPIGRPSLVPV